MEQLSLNQIRERFLQFFESKGHLRLHSFSLIPKDDPSLLLINSGMAPLKPYFIGKEVPPKKRITTCQKCIRTPDIERVGKTTRHGTFFEMLGNFSFGDYFKEEAIRWAWEFISDHLKLPEEKLWVSIYHEDDDAFEIWNKKVGVPAEKIVRLGKKDNFWEIGTGPCGPSSEIYFDTGEKNGCGSPECGVGCDCNRYVEFWNLVFTQFDKDDQGIYRQLENPNIDTGMGLERLAAILQEADNLFEVDTIKRILQSVCNITGARYKTNEKTDVSIRVITDHIRGTVMMISDGVIPSNEGRGYVVRRLIRRAARHGRLLGMDKPFLGDIANEAIKQFEEEYPELRDKSVYIKKVIVREEDKFSYTINHGLNVLDQFINEANSEKIKVIAGDKVFKLHDTYGFPLDLTREIVEENGLSIDQDGFDREMAAQKEMSRKVLQSKKSVGWLNDANIDLTDIDKTLFMRCENARTGSMIMGIILNDKLSEVANEGDQVAMILNKTPFYAESGGQAGDNGYIKNDYGKVRIDDCRKIGNGIYLHIGEVVEGFVEVDMMVDAIIDQERSMSITKNHTCTHLLHRALKNVLGEHVNQAGSLVNEERLRFDFSHFSQVTQEQLCQIELEVNQKILEDLPVNIKSMDFEQAKKEGAMALFEEKYGDTVRVVSIADYSIELCGGTHVNHTSQIGAVKILSESSIASGIRRIEAVTGLGYMRYVGSLENTLDSIAELVKVGDRNVLWKVGQLVQELKSSKDHIEKLETQRIGAISEEVVRSAIPGIDIKMYTHVVEGLSENELRQLTDIVKFKVGTGIVVIASIVEKGKVSLIASATKDVLAKGIHCGKIIKNISKFIEGGGGGRPDMAQAGGKNTIGVNEALRESVNVVKAQLEESKDGVKRK